MARKSADTVKSDNGSVKLMVMAVGQPGDLPDKEVEYSVPSNAMKFQEAILALTGSALDSAYEDYVDGIRKRIRQDAYDAVQSESTWITIPGTKTRKDLMTFPVANFIKSFNHMWNGLTAKAEMYGQSVDEIDRGFGAWRAAARRHEADGKVKIASDGTVTAV